MTNEPVGKMRGWLELAFCTLLIVLVWFVALPNLDRVDWIRERGERLEEAGIEADAMFYTELNWTPPPGAYFR